MKKNQSVTRVRNSPLTQANTLFPRQSSNYKTINHSKRKKYIHTQLRNHHLGNPMSWLIQQKNIGTYPILVDDIIAWAKILLSLFFFFFSSSEFVRQHWIPYSTAYQTLSCLSPLCPCLNINQLLYSPTAISTKCHRGRSPLDSKVTGVGHLLTHSFL